MGADDVLVDIRSILLWIGAGVDLPKGDRGKARDAAAQWRALADRLDASIKTTAPMAADVANKNEGAGIDAFTKSWNTEFAPYPGQVAEYCRRVAAACDGFAEVEDDMAFAITIIAIQTWVNILFTFAWAWVTGYASLGAQLMWIRNTSGTQLLVQQSMFRQIMMRLTEWLIDSLGYAAGQQLLQLGVFGAGDIFGDYDKNTKDMIGYDPYSLDTNLAQFGRAFAANMAFDAVLDGTKAGMVRIPGLRGVPASGFRNRLMGFGARMAGSETYTVVDKSLQGQPPDSWFNWHQQMAKLLIHGPRMVKNPAKGPIGHPSTTP